MNLFTPLTVAIIPGRFGGRVAAPDSRGFSLLLPRLLSPEVPDMADDAAVAAGLLLLALGLWCASSLPPWFWTSRLVAHSWSAPNIALVDPRSRANIWTTWKMSSPWTLRLPMPCSILLYQASGSQLTIAHGCVLRCALNAHGPICTQPLRAFEIMKLSLRSVTTMIQSP